MGDNALMGAEINVDKVDSAMMEAKVKKRSLVENHLRESSSRDASPMEIILAEEMSAQHVDTQIEGEDAHPMAEMEPEKKGWARLGNTRYHDFLLGQIGS